MTAAHRNPDPTVLSGDGMLEGLPRLHKIVLVADAAGHIQWMSERAMGVWGPDAASHCIGRSLVELLPDLELPVTSDGQLIGDGVAHGRTRVGGLDPTLSMVDARVFSLQIGEDGARKIVGVLRPAEASSQRHCSPREAADFLATILDNAPDAVIGIDRTGFITYANKALQRITGRQVSELVDRPLLEFLPKYARLEQVLGVLPPNGELDGAELEFRRPDGSPACVSISARLIRLPDGRAVGNVCFIRDVTERRRVREQLERKNAELESYVHSVSHDLRSPLVSLLGFSRLLREDYGAQLDDTGRHFIDRVEQAGRTMQMLIHDLLELSKIGRPGECRTHVDPRAILLQLQAELKLRLDEQGIDLEIPDNPPPVLCDRTRLYQVFSNLIGNALNHMGPCESPGVVVSIAEESDHHRITVADNGRGIAPADHEKIFEVFRSLGRTQSVEPGGSTGIGLAIARKIVETHEGRIWVESSPGEGARFHFTLPFA